MVFFVGTTTASFVCRVSLSGLLGEIRCCLVTMRNTGASPSNVQGLSATRLRHFMSTPISELVRESYLIPLLRLHALFCIVFVPATL
jgi:hypothetical protein